MRQTELVIAADGRRRRRWGEKSREFSATLLAHVTADHMWDLGRADSDKAQRPVWMAYVASREMTRAFTSNLRGARQAGPSDERRACDRFEIPKSAPHRWTTQEVADGVITMTYVPALFDIEPAFGFADIRFIFMPPRWWVEKQAERLRPELGACAAQAARAALFAGYIDRRTHLPVLQDLRFHVRVFEAAQKEAWCTRPAEHRWDAGLYAEGVEAAGLDLPLAVKVEHAEFEEFLAGQVRRYYEEEVSHGANRVGQDRRLLPDAARAPQQLCLDFGVGAF